MYLIFIFREFKSIHKGKMAILHLCFGTEKNRRLVAKKPDIIGLFAGDIFFVSTLWWTRRDSNPRPLGCERIKSYDLYCFLAISGAFGWNVNGLVTSFARCNHVSRKCLWYALWSQEHKRKGALPVRVYHSPKQRKRQRFS